MPRTPVEIDADALKLTEADKAAKKLKPSLIEVTAAEAALQARDPDPLGGLPDAGAPPRLLRARLLALLRHVRLPDAHLGGAAHGDDGRPGRAGVSAAHPPCAAAAAESAHPQ